jgi:acyl-CoA synthetase (NDP forming)
VVFAAGYDTHTEAGRELAAALRAAQAESGIRVLGPNSLGFRVVQSGVFATFSHDIEMGVRPGSIAMISQSGGLGGYFGAAYLGLCGAGSRYVVDTGNELDLDAAEVLEYVAQDEAVTGIALILEGSRRGRRLAAAVSTAVANGKTVAFLHVGRSARGSRQIASHTGSLAATAGLFDVAMRDAGARVVADEGELVDALVLLDADRVPSGPRIGVVSASGGFAILSLDAAERFGVQLPPPAEPPLEAELPGLASGELGNPYDYVSIAPAGPDTLRASLAWMTRQPNLDAVVLWQAHGLYAIESRRAALLQALDHVLPNARMPIYGCGVVQQSFKDTLRDRGVLWFEEPTRLIRALGTTARDRRDPDGGHQAARAHSTHGAPVEPAVPDVVVGAQAQQMLPFLEHVRSEVVDSVEAARRLAGQWGRLVLKVESERHPHKTEYGLVSGPVSLGEVGAAYERIVAARRACGAEDVPVIAQTVESGVEVALGGFMDASFGPVLMVGMGGILLEIMRDTAFALAPVDVGKAREMILGLRGSALLQGARGRPVADVDALATAAAAFSEFLTETAGTFESVDINPLIVREQGRGAVAVDLLLIRKPGAVAAPDSDVDVRQRKVGHGAG